ncbi:unnamed protein product [Sphagnum compactum]
MRLGTWAGSGCNRNDEDTAEAPTNREQGMDHQQQQQASQTGAMKPDSSSAAGVVLSVEHPIPPRRRLVKSASAAAAYGRRGHVEPTREGEGGFVSPGSLDRSGNTTSAPAVSASGIGVAGALNPGAGVVPPAAANNSLAGGFRDRERGPLRESIKGEMHGDQSSLTQGNSGSSKLGRYTYANAGAPEARPLVRRPEVNVRRHEPPSQKHSEERRLQQAKRAALGRAQSLGAPGHFKSFDSPFGNFMVPVIPLQFFNKPQTAAAPTGAVAVAPSLLSAPLRGTDR